MKVGSPSEKHIKFMVGLEGHLPSKVNVYENQEASSEDIVIVIK